MEDKKYKEEKIERDKKLLRELMAKHPDVVVEHLGASGSKV